MKTFLAFIGGIHLVLFILGALNIIDYHVCIKDAGKCTADYQLPEQPVAYLTYLKDEVATLRKSEKFPQDSELQNSVDEIAQLIDSTLYKLRFLS